MSRYELDPEPDDVRNAEGRDPQQDKHATHNHQLSESREQRLK
jgi:hypothetical protein